MCAENSPVDYFGDPSRFDLEEALTATFNIADDIRLLVGEVMDESLPPDELATALDGMATLHRLRCEKAFAIFSQLVENKVIQ